MAHTSCSNLSNFCCNSRKYRDVMRPWLDLSKQSRASSVIWWWVKLSTPSARGRTFSGEWFVIMSRSFSSIWAVAYRQTDTQYTKSALHETNSLKVHFWYCDTSVLPKKLPSWNAWNDGCKKARKQKRKVKDDVSPHYQSRKATALLFYYGDPLLCLPLVINCALILWWSLNRAKGTPMTVKL